MVQTKPPKRATKVRAKLRSQEMLIVPPVRIKSQAQDREVPNKQVKRARKVRGKLKNLEVII
jgi:hypothetical protein